MNEEIKKFNEFRTDEDGTHFYYNNQNNEEQWSYELDKLEIYITNLQEENYKLKETNEEHRKINGQLRKENKILRENAEHNDKVVDKVNWENQKLVKVIDEIEKEIWKIRQLTFTKYNSNEWNNCLSFNDDILPIINKLTELKGGSDDVEN